MGRVSLADCPRELQLSILGLLATTDLHSVNAVSNHFHNLAEVLIYENVEIIWWRDELPPIPLLLRSLLERPQLGQLIRGLHLHGRGFVMDNRDIDEPPTLPVATLPIANASELIESTNVPHTKLWTDEFQSGKVDALVALLISMLPNLKMLHLGPNFTIESRLLGLMFRFVLCEPEQASRLPAFQGLQDVTFGRRTNEYRHLKVNNTADVLPFFYLPTVRHLSVSIDNPKEFIWPAQAPTPSSLRSLELRRLRENRLEPILATLNGLERLHWHCFYEADLDTDVSGHVIELDKMTKALNHVGDTLVDLTIKAETFPDLSRGGFERPFVEIRGSLRGLSRLGQLKKLRMPWAFLMGFSPPGDCHLGHLLPPTLQLLSLTLDLDEPIEQWMWDDDSVVQAIESAVHDESMSSLPDLRRINLPIEDEMTEERKTELRRISDSAGVELGWNDD